MRSFCSLAVMAALFLPAEVRAESELAERQNNAAARAVETVIRPGYQALAASTAHLAELTAAFCLKPQTRRLREVQDAFHKAADDWARIEVVRTGAIAEGLGFERMDHYPERKNAIAKGLAALDALPPETVIDAALLAETSAAVEGLSALERVLFETEVQHQIGHSGAAGHRRCAIAAGISGSLAERSKGVAAAWTAMPSDPRAFLSELATDLLTLYRMLADTKIGAVAGEGVDGVNPKAGPMWRSGRGNRIIAENLAGAERLTAALIDTDQEGRATLLATISAALQVARTMPAPIDQMAGRSETRSRVVLLLSAIRSARDETDETLPVALGITLGFNALDGD